jgi:AcrR family transcriptional regulator
MPRRPPHRSPRAARPRRPRWQRRPDARPEEILDAALAIFGEQGFARARCDDVARRAGISKGTLYLYFDSKESLFREMVRARLGPVIAEGQEFVRTFEGTSRELLVALIGRLWTAMSSPDKLRISRLMIAEISNYPELARFYYDEVIRPARLIMETVIARGTAGGEFRPVDPTFASRAIQLLCIQFIQHITLFQRYDATMPPEATARTGIVDLVLRGIEAE